MRLFQAALDTPLDSPFSATLSVHGLPFTVCAPLSRVFFQQDTKEYLNQRGTKIRVFRESKRGDKGGGEEGRSGGRVNRA